MRRAKFLIAAGSFLTAIGLFPTFLSGAPPASKEKVIYSFKGGSDGLLPQSELVTDATGSLYGTTISGGIVSKYCDNGCGTVFKLTPTKAGWKHEVLYSFAGLPDGYRPMSGLVFDRKGNLYGTASGGGYFDDLCVSGCGTAFEVSPQPDGSWVETTLHVFQDAPDGAKPSSG